MSTTSRSILPFNLDGSLVTNLFLKNKNEEIEQILSKHLNEYGINQADFVQDQDAINNFLKQHNQELINVRSQTKKEFKVTLSKLAGTLKKLYPVLSTSPKHKQSFLLKLFLFSTKLQSLYGHKQYLKESLGKFTLAIKDLPSYDQAFKEAEENLILLRKVLLPINQYTRHYYDVHCKQNREALDMIEQFDDDVAYDHSLASEKSYYDSSRIYLKGRRYLALHYPRPDNLSEFFETLVHNKIETLICLKEPLESGSNNESTGGGFRYWPSLPETPFQFKKWKIILGKETHHHHPTDPFSIEFLTERRLILQQSGKEDYHIRQIHYRCWEDGGIPNPRTFDSLLEMLETPNSREHPIAVHCHAGIGRTGVFIMSHAIRDTLSRKYKLRSFDDLNSPPPTLNIYSLLTRLRLQRESVQSASQLAFVIASVRRSAIRLNLAPEDSPSDQIGLSHRWDSVPIEECYSRLSLLLTKVATLDRGNTESLSTFFNSSKFKDLAGHGIGGSHLCSLKPNSVPSLSSEKLSMLPFFNLLPQGLDVRELASRSAKMHRSVLLIICYLLEKEVPLTEMEVLVQDRLRKRHGLESPTQPIGEHCANCSVLHLVFFGSSGLLREFLQETKGR
eukprot:TRINITY_DN7584_c0_g1_i1.p1 TRINITY_DN7584_c0_g1~~TRINITY_DN7584_c0_g1_i1.p1  ORF type:complete len:619 (-),score=108.94 TRINITY_DN7584_c0_g1_i1:151-2007(-)